MVTWSFIQTPKPLHVHRGVLLQQAAKTALCSLQCPLEAPSIHQNQLSTLPGINSARLEWLRRPGDARARRLEGKCSGLQLGPGRASCATDNFNTGFFELFVWLQIALA